MNRLWVFGDSYADINESYGPNQWQLLLAEYFNLELHSVSENGTSCLWLLLKWHELITKISPEDKVIFLIPFSGRSLIFKNDPGLSSITCLDLFGKDTTVNNRWKNYNEQQIDAFKKYFMYIYDHEINLSIAFSLLNTINNCSVLLDTPPLIINTSDESLPEKLLYNCGLAIGSTININIGEFEEPKAWNEIANRGLFLDPRICHMSEPNHIIFSEKIKDYFIKGEIPNLNEGFHKKIFSKKDIAKNC